MLEMGIFEELLLQNKVCPAMFPVTGSLTNFVHSGVNILRRQRHRVPYTHSASSYLRIFRHAYTNRIDVIGPGYLATGLECARTGRRQRQRRRWRRPRPAPLRPRSRHAQHYITRRGSRASNRGRATPDSGRHLVGRGTSRYGRRRYQYRSARSYHFRYQAARVENDGRNMGVWVRRRCYRGPRLPARDRVRYT
jgi:hypothetical protein